MIIVDNLDNSNIKCFDRLNTIIGKPEKIVFLQIDIKNQEEMEKLVSRKLRINAKETMKIAEKLYTQGYISYPRTETNIFPKELDLQPLVEMQTGDASWGNFANRILEEGINPRQGKKSISKKQKWDLLKGRLLIISKLA